jgi:hypothetical protein
MAISSFVQTIDGLKYSGVYRRLCRVALDATMPFPPSFYTRRREGIPVPKLDLSCQDAKYILHGYSKQHIGKQFPGHEQAGVGK